MNYRTLIFASLAALLSACGGAGTTGPSAPLQLASVSGSVTLTFSTVPTAQKARNPKFISPSASSLSIRINGGVSTIADISASSPNCKGTGAGRSCAIPVVAPPGSDTFVVTLFAGPNGSGSILGTSTVVQTITAANFTVAMTVQGVIASVQLSAATASFSAGTPGSTAISATALDAGGNTIIGTYANPITLSNSDTSGAITLSSQTISSSSQIVTATYNGSMSASSAVISASVPGVSAANIQAVSLTIVASSLNLYTTQLGNYSLTVTPANGNGNTPASRVVIGGNTQISEPYDVAIDGAGVAYISALRSATITAYAAGANGNVAPIRTITGSNTGLNYPLGLAIDSAGNLIADNFAGQTVTVFAPGANGNVAPIRTIAGAATGLSQPYGLTLDGAGNLYVVDNVSQFGGTDKITVYAPGATGNVAPIRTITGGATGMNGAVYDAVDAAGKVYLTNGYANSVTVYPNGANGNVAPIATIAGPATTISGPGGIVLDSGGNIYVANGGDNSILVFAAGSNGNVAPVRKIIGPSTGFNVPLGLALAP